MQAPGESDEPLELDRAFVHAKVATALFGEPPANLRFGRFELEQRIGSGSMGVVYRARDVASDERVALKLLPRLDATAIARFKREFRSLQGVIHPNLIALHELFCEAGSWFFSMELVPGVPFVEWVRHAGALDVNRLRRALAQLVEAVSAIHAAGKLHCDLKPSNVLVTDAGRLVVLDFGLASEMRSDGVADSAQTGFFGTPAYAAPERAALDRATRASDWYSVGVMLFEALTGQLPFSGDALEILSAKQHSDAPDPRAFSEGVPDDLFALCSGLLTRDASQRLDGRALARSSLGIPVAEASSVANSKSRFVGREREIAALEAALAQARTGRAIAIMIGGTSGIGKTALLSSFAERVGRDVLLLRGRCHEHESVPYKVFDAVLDAIAGHLRKQPELQLQQLLPRHVDALRRLFPVLGQVEAIRSGASNANHDPRTQRNRAFAALKELLSRLTDRTPVVVMVDDLQWGDADSARMLAHVLGPPDPPPLLFVGAYRSEEERRSEFLIRVFDPAAEAITLNPERLALGPLESQKAAELASRLLEGAGEACALAIAHEAQGVPFFITELAQYAQRRASAATGPAPASLEQLILERLATIPEAAQHFLRVLAVAAAPLELGIARSATGAAVDPACLNLLRSARFIRTRGNGPLDLAEPYHDRIRETVVASLERDAVVAVHAAIADAMERSGQCDPERLLPHFEGAQQTVRAAAAALEAARSAASQLAFNRAAELYMKTLALLPPAQSSASELQRELGNALANAGRGAEAAEAYLRAASASRGTEARAFKRMAARQLFRSGRIEDAMRLAQTLFREVGLAFPSTRLKTGALYAVNRTLLRFAPSHYDRDETAPADHVASERLATLDAAFREASIVNPMKGAAMQAQFLRYARKAKDAQRLMEGLAWEAWNAATLNPNPRQALRVLGQTEAIASSIGTPYALATAKSARAGSCLFLGRVGEVVTPALESERIFREECPGTYWEQSLVATYRYAGIEHSGEFRVLVQELPLRMRDSLERNDHFGTAFFTLYGTLTNLILDRPHDARELIQNEQRRLASGYSTFHVFVAIRTVHAMLYVDDAEAALTFLQSELRRFAASVCSRARFYASTMSFLEGRACLALSRSSAGKAELLERAERNARGLRAMQQPMALALGQLLLAEVAYRRGQHDVALDILARCANGTGSHQSPFFALSARRGIGLLLGGDQGKRSFDAAEEEMRAQGIVNPARLARVWLDVER